MGYTERTVGQMYQIDYRYTKCVGIELKMLRKDNAGFAVYYECGVKHLIPYNNDIEFYEENETDNEGAVKQD